MKQFLKIFLVISFFIPLFLLLRINPFAIPISPDKYYIDGSNQQELSQELTIYGREELADEQKLYFSVIGMKKFGEEHEREFYIPNPNDDSEAANWVKLKFEEAVIKPGDTIILPWTIKIPDNMECATKTAAIMVSNSLPNPSSNQTVVSVEKQVISQIHINLEDEEGSCIESLSLVDFFVNRKFKVFNYDNIPFSTRIENSGLVLSQNPKGFIEIYGMGDKISIPFNEESLDIYPKTTRKFSNTWIDPDYPHNGNFFQKISYELSHLRIGKYEARLGITKNIDQQIIAYETFWIIPWRITLILGLIIGITALVASRKKSITSHESKRK